MFRALLILLLFYAYSIVTGHAYNDGNKRTAIIAMLVFLQLNGHSFKAPEFEIYNTILALADKTILYERFRSWVQANIV